MNQITLINDDCLVAIKNLPDNSVDSIVTDPPYHLTSITKRFGKEGSAPAQFGTDGAFKRASKGFMNQTWDGGDISFRTQIWEECLRVLKPGGHLLSFGGSRTYHRMAVAIEDAGFEIRDQIMWIYGSGFPKSYNIGKAIDRLQGNEREVVGKGNYRDIRGGALDASLTQDRDRLEIDLTKGKSEWEGWGTSLKPAHEPIVLARKPFVGNVAQNVLAWDTGGINIDESRIPTDDNLQRPNVNGFNKEALYSNFNNNGSEKNGNYIDTGSVEGRFPANVIFDEEAGKILDEQSGYSKSAVFDSEKYKSIAGLKVGNTYNKPKKSLDNIRGFNDEGGATRYFLNVDNTDDEDFDTSTNHNPILMARKPFKGGVAENVLAWGTGGLNIDDSRIDGEPWVRDNTKGKADMYEGWGMKPNIKSNESGGRFPANVVFDSESAKILDEQSGINKSVKRKKESNTISKPNIDFGGGIKNIENEYNDEGGASRFFYCAKASKKDRNEGLYDFEDKKSRKWRDDKGMKFTGSGNPRKEVDKNIHPTVKPTKLMEYLIKLITPKSGVILDPFMGSGSTGKGAIKNGFNFIGIEKEKEYFDIAKARIEHAKGSGLFATEINQNEL